MSKGQKGRSCNPTFYKTRHGVIHKKVGRALKHSAKGITRKSLGNWVIRRKKAQS